MKKWGVVISAVYAVIVLGLLAPAFLLLAASSTPGLNDLLEFYRSWGLWLVAGIFVLGQVLLLTISVDATRRRLRPRTSIVISAAVTGFFLMIVTVSIYVALVVAMQLEDHVPSVNTWAGYLSLLFGPWIIWGVLFYFLYRDSTDPVTRAVAWLLRGSVLELLVAVPSHVIVRRRNECSAPLATGFGITTGIAIMLLSFGPSVLLLFKKRMEKYSPKDVAAK